ncbi:dihydrolipoamide dehydrogenase, partial [Rhizobium sp. TRM95111]|nr:dihydrolipoamide dehydrogenase [Rhizobium alarense]
PFAENDRAQIEGETTGFVKLVAGARGRVLGVAIAGADAGEMITLWALVVERRMRLKHLAGFVPPYPVRSEIGKRAAISYYAPMARNRWIRALVRFLRRFG